MSGKTNSRPNMAYQSAASEPLYKTENTIINENEVTDSSASSLKKKEQWRPGYFSQFPWSGFGALMGVLICTVVCVVVVYASNGKAKSEWKGGAAPNVMVSVFTAIASILITMAVGNGIAISWWRKAIKGSTVEDLHKSWSFGSSIVSIVTGLKFFNVMALAALCTKLAIIDGILFQKALTTTTALGPPSNSSVDFYSFSKFPITGQLNQFGNDTAEQTFPMTYDMIWWLQSDINTGIDWYRFIVGNQFAGCEGLCSFPYRAIGFASSCSLPTNKTDVSRNRSAVLAGNDVLLDINFAYQQPTAQKNYSHILMDWQTWSSYSSDTYANTNCTGDFIHLQCELRPAIMDYPIVLQNSSISGRSKKGSKSASYTIKIGNLNETDGTYDGQYVFSDMFSEQQVNSIPIIKYLDVQEQYTPGGNSSLGGIVTALNTYYKTRSVATYQRQNSTSSQNATYAPVNQNSGLQIAFAQMVNYNDGCPTGFTSPFWVENNTLSYDEMLMNINQLTLITASDPYLQADYPGQYEDTEYNPDLFTSYVTNFIANATMVGLKPEIYYYSKVGFAWGAFASTLVIVLCIIPSYWGYWELGRKVTLGPLEIANAFEAPAFSHVDRGTGHVDHVLDAVGKQKVKYDVNGKYGFVHH